MATTLTYNSYANLASVKIVAYSDEPEMAEDGITVEMHHHTIAGTALITATAANFAAELENARARLLRPQGDLTVTIDGRTIFSPTAPDQHGGPRGTFHIVEAAVYGNRAAVVTFRIEWWEIEPDGTDVLHSTGVLSHRWTQELKQDAIGHARLTVRGSLRVRGNASDTGSSEVGTGRNPDAYRLKVTPEIPGGFRMVDRTFAIDESGNRLMYEVVYQEFARNLPHPARVGNARFFYQRSLEGDSAAGIKTFECELESSRHFSTGALIDAAMKVAAKRIRFGADIILGFTLAEEDMFTSNKVRIQIRAIDKAGVDQFERLLPTTVAIGDNFMEGIEGYRDLNVYGAAMIRAVRGNFFAPINASASATINKAEVEGDLGDILSYVPTATYQFPSAVYDVVKDPNLTGPVGGTNQNNGYIQVESVERIKTVTNFVVLSSQVLSAADVPFQIRKPEVYLESEITAVRRLVPPTRGLLATPHGSVILEQDVGMTDVEVGNDGSKVFTVKHRRLCRLLDIEMAGGWGTLPNTLVKAGGNYRGWGPPNGALAVPYDPRVRNDIPAANDVLSPAGDSVPVTFDEYTTA